MGAVPVLQDRADLHVARSVGDPRHGAVEHVLRGPARRAAPTTSE
jgi:hypothetical protein